MRTLPTCPARQKGVGAPMACNKLIKSSVPRAGFAWPCCIKVPPRCFSQILLRNRLPPRTSLSGREVRVQPLAYLHHLLAGEAAAGGEIGDRLEVVILSSRQAPVEHARRRVADILEAVHHVAGDKDESSGADYRGLAAQ